MKVVVVGGGLAGMTAAILLKDAGCQVELHEAKSRLGGRVGSYWDREGEKWVDYCQHVGMECCTHLVWWIDRFQQREYWDVCDRLHFVSPAGKKVTIRPLPLPAPLHLSSLLWSWPGLKLGERLQVARGLLALMRLTPGSADRGRLNQEDWSNRLAVEWLEEQGQSRTVIDRFWGTILTSALGDTVDRVLLGPTRKVLVDGFAASRNAYRLWVPNRSLATLVSANAEAILQKAGVKVVKESRIDRLEFDGAKCIGVVDSHGESIAADRVVIGVPWHAVGKLLFAPRENSQTSQRDSLLGEQAKRLQQQLPLWDSAPITGVHTWWDRPWLTTSHAILIDRLSQWIFPAPKGEAEFTGSDQDAASHLEDKRIADASGVYYQVVISGSRQLPKGDSSKVIDMVREELQQLFPEARQAKLLRAKVVTDPQAVFSLPRDLASSRCASDLLAGQGVWLCGDWTDTKWPATMEGAIRSGWNVAEKLVPGQLRRPPDLPRGWLARWCMR